MRVDPLVGKVVTDGLGSLGQHRLMQDGDLVPAGEQFLQLGQQPGTDHHRVRRVDGHLHGDRFFVVAHVAAPLAVEEGLVFGVGSSRRDMM